MNGLSTALLGDAFCEALFGADAEIKAMLRVEAALAKAQGACGLIPIEAATILFEQLPGLDIQADELAEETRRNGVVVPGLIVAIRKRLPKGEAAQWLHWGATSQDIIDTALVLRLKELITELGARIDSVCGTFAHLATAHADLPMVGRSFGQAAAPTTFGAVIASWGSPLLRYRTRLEGVSTDLFKVSLGGAVGNLSAMGAHGAEVRAALATELGLADPGASWHAERDSIAVFATWLAGVANSLGKFAEDVILHAQTGIDEITLAGAGGSSTMPQKQNPIRSSAIVALARQSVALSSLLQGAAGHRQNRDGAAWFTEWLSLPALCTSTAAALQHAIHLADELSPNQTAMQRNLDANGGLVYAEAMSFALSEVMSRPDAQARVKHWCVEAAKGQNSLLQLAKHEFPDRDWEREIITFIRGESTALGRDFATRVQARL